MVCTNQDKGTCDLRQYVMEKPRLLNWNAINLQTSMAASFRIIGT